MNEATKITTTHTEHAACLRLADNAIEVGAFEVGPECLRRYVRVLHVASDPFGLFMVEDFTKCDDEDAEPSTFYKFANLALAFQKAVELAQEEIADVCDTVEG